MRARPVSASLYGQARRLALGCEVYELLVFWRSIAFGIVAGEIWPGPWWGRVALLVGVTLMLEAMHRAQLAYEVERVCQHFGALNPASPRFGLRMFEALGVGRMLGPHLRAIWLFQGVGVGVGLSAQTVLRCLLGGLNASSSWLCAGMQFALGVGWWLGAMALRRRLWRVGYALIGRVQP